MSVNYLLEINALNDWELTNPIGDTAYKVLCKLYYLANKERFPEWIRVSNGMLMSLVGCSEKSLIAARNKLIQNGRIVYKGQKKLTPMYSIRYFSEDSKYNCKNSSYTGSYNGSINGSYNGSINGGYTCGTITNNKLNENKENRNLYTDEQLKEVQSIAEQLAAQSNHAGNMAYIAKIRMNLLNAGTDAIEAARKELRPAAGAYQTHSYTEADFDESFYYDPARDFTGVRG